MIFFGFYVPIGATIYSFMYAFYKKKTIHDRQLMNSNLQSPMTNNDNEFDDQVAMLKFWDSSSSNATPKGLFMPEGLVMDLTRSQDMNVNRTKVKELSNSLMTNPYEDKNQQDVSRTASLISGESSSNNI